MAAIHFAYPNLDKHTGRFLPLKKGEKPPKMLAMEKELGIRFEDDYEDRYLGGEIGQTVFARRWQVSKNRIFDQNPNAARRSWSTMLGLMKRNAEHATSDSQKRNPCEGCGMHDIPLERAHWIERKYNGRNESWNIAKLCPNCHSLLDRGDPSITEIVRRALFARVVKKIVQQESEDVSFPDHLLSVCSAIILHRKKA